MRRMGTIAILNDGRAVVARLFRGGGLVANVEENPRL